MAPKFRHAATTAELRGRAEYWVRLSASVVEEIWNDRVARWCGVAALGFLAYATLVDHAQRPCLQYTVAGKLQCLKR